ncbi:MAG: DUF6528 family protein, partial [Cephaloticoccus sp.]|nr:DUF6528 family protein [Cephaloticoccus sp.]
MSLPSDHVAAHEPVPTDQGDGAHRICNNTRLILAVEHAQTRILLLDPDLPWTDPAAMVWEWRADTDPKAIAWEERAQHASPLADRLPFFINPSDAKRIHQGTQILAIMCGGAATLIDVATRRIAWLGEAGNNPHSITLLPHGCVATVSSTGSQLRLFLTNSAPSGEAVAEYSLFDGHGVHWDEKRQCLWALGGQELRRYQLLINGGKAELQLSGSYALPAIDIARTEPVFIHGHDLAKTESPDAFYLTDAARIWRFQPDEGTLQPAPELPLLSNIKSISRHPDTAEIIIQQPTESWWSDTLRNVDGT